MAKKMGGTLSSFNLGHSVALDASGNVYTTGSFSRTVDFNPDTTVSYNLTAASSDDIFISKLDTSGNFVWAKRIGDTLSDQGASIKIDVSGNVYITVYFSGTVDFNPDPAVTNNLTSAVNQDNYFISKFSTSGNFIWAKQLRGDSSSTSYGTQIVVDTSGNAYTTGSFSGTADFNPDTTVIYNLTSAGLNDIFINKLDSFGNFVWAKRLGGTSDDGGISIAIDASRNIYTTGYFSDTADFDPDPVVTNNLISAGDIDVFTVKLSQPATILPVNFISVNAFQKNEGVQVDWRMAAESNILVYEVEKSSDGVSFAKTGAIIPTSNNNSSVSYDWFDASPLDGNNFYRIKAVELSSGIKYSSVIRLNIKKGRSTIIVSPNPVINNALNLQLQNLIKGTYTVRLFNNAGQLLYTVKIEHPGGTSAQTIYLKSKIAPGIYQLQVTNGEMNVSLKVIL